MNPVGLAILVATTLFPAVQLFSLPDVSDSLALFSQYLGIAALILMAWAQIWATRLPGVEALFGGLDRVYVLHKWSGIIAMAAILLHDTIDADMDGLGRETLLSDLAETLGELSLYGLLILVVISVATFIPYQLWKWTHKAMGAFFVAGALHFVFILKPFAMTDPAGVYTGLFCLAGVIAYGWTLLPERMRPAHRYEIVAVEQTGGATAIELKPQGKPLKPHPGQFGVFRFTGANKAEPHPFSFSAIGADHSLRVSVKALGDFTAGLGNTVQPGQSVHLQGPFGHFRYRRTTQQIWIAGGIGITPFLTWAEAASAEDGRIDLFYCVRGRDQAPHLAEIERRAEALPNMTLHIISSGEGTRLSAALIAERVGADLSGVKVAFCGPAPLRKLLQSELPRYGVSPRHFRYEQFEFRTGIGLKALATVLLEKRRAIQRT